MIKAQMSFGAKPIYDKPAFVKKFGTVFHGIGNEVATEILPLVQETFAMPGSVHYPITWTTPKQRKYFFYAIREGIIPGYRFDEKGNIISGPPREGKIVKKWKTVWKTKPNTLAGVIEAYNTAKYAKWVYGGFTVKAQASQQRFHWRSGWMPAREGREIIMTKALELVEQKYNEALGEFGPLLTGRV